MSIAGLEHYQVAMQLADDMLTEPLPIAEGPTWGVPQGVGLCVDVDQDRARQYARYQEEHGPLLPYQPGMLGRTARLDEGGSS